MIIKDSSGSFYEVAGTPFDPAGAGQAYLEAVSSLQLAQENAQTQVDAITAQQAEKVAAMLAGLNAVMAEYPETATLIQPSIDSATTQFPAIVSNLKS
jgi:hypothetical protein